MIETIVMVRMSKGAEVKGKEQWWNDVQKATIGASKWMPSDVDGFRFLISNVGTFELNDVGFASGMMCDLNTWKNDYEVEFRKVLNSAFHDVHIDAREMDVSLCP